MKGKVRSTNAFVMAYQRPACKHAYMEREDGVLMYAGIWASMFMQACGNQLHKAMEFYVHK